MQTGSTSVRSISHRSLSREGAKDGVAVVGRLVGCGEGAAVVGMGVGCGVVGIGVGSAMVGILVGSGGGAMLGGRTVS